MPTTNGRTKRWRGASPLRLTRIAAGLRQVDVELKTGISTARLSRVERGVTPAYVDEVKALADAYTASLEEILEAAIDTVEAARA